MQTIIYQGQAIEAELVNYISGHISTSTTDVDGDEALLRDEQGRYYLRRTLHWLDHDGPNERRASGRTLTHRLNVNAAILWATTRLNSETLDLRQDAADLLMEGRGHRDPHPSHLRAEQLALVRTPQRFAVDDAPSARYGVSASTLAAAGRYAATAGRSLEEMVAEFLEMTATMAPDDETPEGEADLPPAGAEPSPVEEASEAAAACHRFTFDYPPTARRCGLRRAIRVSEEQMNRVRELAPIFKLSPTRFLRALADNNHLPGQPRWSKDDKFRDALGAEHIAFACMEEAMARRIERAAQSRRQTSDEFVANAVGGDVDLWEENMLLHPATGELLEADFESLFTEDECEMLVGPGGREHEAQFQTHHGRKYVRFGAYLTPEQLARLEYPHPVSDCEADEEVTTLLVPFDEAGSPRLEVDGRQVKLDEALRPTAATTVKEAA